MSETRWQLDVLRTYLKNAGGSDAGEELLKSIGQSVRIFRYHMANARDAYDGIVNFEEPEGIENFLLFVGQSDKSDEFRFAHVVCEAHLVGCLHTARNMWDHFGQLVNLALLRSSISFQTCDIYKVRDQLPDCDLKEYVNTVLSLHWYRYTSAFVNVTKHRRLITHNVTVDVHHKKAGFQVLGFDYGGVVYERYWGIDVLQGAIDVKNGLIAAGRLLNKHFGLAP
jgi:hypothetical protein